MAAMNPPLGSRARGAGLAARLGWEARRLGRRIGAGAAPGLLGLALAALAAWQIGVLDARQLTLHQQIAAAQRAAGVAARAPAELPDAARQLRAFYAFLPAHDAIPDQLKLLVTLAEKSGVTLDSADYKAQQEEHAEFMRYQISLPIKADAAKLQAFLVAALHALPALTLESLAFKRAKADSNEVEARIQLVLLVRKAPAQGSGR